MGFLSRCVLGGETQVAYGADPDFDDVAFLSAINVNHPMDRDRTTNFSYSEVVEDLTNSLAGSIRLNKPEDASLKSIQRKHRQCAFFWLGAGEGNFLPSAGCCFYTSAKRRVRQVHGNEVSLFVAASKEGHNMLLFRVMQPHDVAVL